MILHQMIIMAVQVLNNDFTLDEMAVQVLNNDFARDNMAVQALDNDFTLDDNYGCLGIE